LTLTEPAFVRHHLLRTRSPHFLLVVNKSTKTPRAFLKISTKSEVVTSRISAKELVRTCEEDSPASTTCRKTR
jgi:hypothetical protein